jgi:hypothetical protein
MSHTLSRAQLAKLPISETLSKGNITMSASKSSVSTAAGTNLRSQKVEESWKDAPTLKLAII